MSSSRDYTHTNPYAQGGWSDNSGFWRLSPSGNSPASSGSSGSGNPSGQPAYHPQQTTFGALPGSSSQLLGPLATEYVAFLFDTRRGLQDQYVLGPGQSIVHRILAQGPTLTAISDAAQRVVATVEWHQIPVLVKSGRRFSAPEWLRSVTGSQAMRCMNVRGIEYYWSFDSRHFYIHPGGQMARPIGMVMRTSQGMQIRLHPSAYTPELLENCVLAIILLQGRSFVGL